MPNLRDIWDNLPDVPTEQSDNVITRGVDQITSGLKEGTLGIAKGIADLGVGTGAIFKKPELEKKSQELSQYFNKQLNRPDVIKGREVMVGWDRPVEKSLRLLGNAAPSIMSAWAGGAVGATVGAGAVKAGLFKSSPKLAQNLAGWLGSFTGSIPLGASIAGSYWSEGVEAGKDRTDPVHYATALTDGVVQSILETMPFMGWMKGGKLGTRVLRGAMQEGGEEVVQQVFENSLKIVGWKGTQNLYNDMVTGIADNFVAGALSGGLLGTAKLGITKEDQIHDLTNDIAKGTFLSMKKEGSDIEYGVVHQAVKQIVGQFDKLDLDGIVLPTMIKNMKNIMSSNLEMKATGKHGTVERSKVEDGMILTTDDDTYMPSPLDTTAEGESARKLYIRNTWKNALDNKIRGHEMPFDKLPEVMRWNIMNNPALNTKSSDIAITLKRIAEQEFDKLVVHVDGSADFTNPRNTVFFGPLTNVTSPFIHGREETKTKPIIHGQIWLQELARIVHDANINPFEIEFVGKGSQGAMSTFLSMYKEFYGTISTIPIDKRKKVDPKDYNKNKNEKAYQKVIDHSENVAEDAQKDTEKQIAYENQEKYVAKLNKAVHDMWEDVRSAAGGNMVSEALQLIDAIVSGKPINIFNEEGKPWLQARSVQDLAEIFSAWRNPLLEITQAVFVNNEGIIISHEAISILQPGVTVVQTALLRQKAEALGAKYYVIHNHPSGDTRASTEDKNTQLKLMKDKNFLGQLILDHKQFAYLDLAGGVHQTLPKTPKVFFHRDRAALKSIFDATNSNFREGRITLIITDGSWLQAVEYLPVEGMVEAIKLALVRHRSSAYVIGTTDQKLIPHDLPVGVLGILEKQVGKNLQYFTLQNKDGSDSGRGTIPVWEVGGHTDIYRFAAHLEQVIMPVVKNIRFGLPGTKGTTSKGKGICDYTSRVMVDALNTAGIKAEVVEIKAKSPVGDFNIVHRVAQVESDGKKYLVDDPQHRFMKAGEEGEGAWLGGTEGFGFSGPLKSLGTFMEFDGIPNAFTEKGYVDPDGYSAPFRFSNVRIEGKYKVADYNDNVLVRILNSKRDGVEYSFEYKEKKGAAIYTKSFFEPMLFERTDATLKGYRNGTIGSKGFADMSSDAGDTEKVVQEIQKIKKLHSTKTYTVSKEPVAQSVITPNGTYIDASGGHDPLLREIYNILGKPQPNKIVETLPTGYVRKLNHNYSINSVDDAIALKYLKRDVELNSIKPVKTTFHLSSDFKPNDTIIIDVDRGSSKQQFRHATIKVKDVLDGDLRSLIIEDLRRTNIKYGNISLLKSSLPQQLSEQLPATGIPNNILVQYYNALKDMVQQAKNNSLRNGVRSADYTTISNFTRDFKENIFGRLKKKSGQDWGKATSILYAINDAAGANIRGVDYSSEGHNWTSNSVWKTVQDFENIMKMTAPKTFPKVRMVKEGKGYRSDSKSSINVAFEGHQALEDIKNLFKENFKVSGIGSGFYMDGQSWEDTTVSVDGVTKKEFLDLINKQQAEEPPTGVPIEGAKYNLLSAGLIAKLGEKYEPGMKSTEDAPFTPPVSLEYGSGPTARMFPSLTGEPGGTQVPQSQVQKVFQSKITGATQGTVQGEPKPFAKKEPVRRLTREEVSAIFKKQQEAPAGERTGFGKKIYQKDYAPGTIRTVKDVRQPSGITETRRLTNKYRAGDYDVNETGFTQDELEAIHKELVKVYGEVKPPESVVKFIEHFGFGGGDELGWMLKDQLIHLNYTKAGKDINSFSMIDMLNKLYEEGAFGKRLATMFHDKLKLLLTAQEYEFSAKGRTQVEAYNKGVVENIRSLMFHLGHQRDIRMRQIVETDAHGAVVQRGDTVKSKFGRYMFDTYRTMHNLWSQLIQLTGEDVKKLNKEFNTGPKGGKKLGHDLAEVSPDQLEGVTASFLPAGSTLKKGKISQKQQKINKEFGVPHAERIGDSPFFITYGAMGPYPWFGSNGLDAEGNFIGVIPALKLKLKENPADKALIEKIAELEEVVRWIKYGDKKPVAVRADYKTEEEFAQAKRNIDDADQKRYKGLEELIDKFVIEQRDAITEFMSKVQGVWVQKEHVRWDVKEKKDVFIDKGPYLIVRDPSEPQLGRMTKDIGKDFANSTGPVIIVQHMESQWKPMTTVNGVRVRDTEYTKRGREYSSAYVFFSTEEMNDIIENGVVVGGESVPTGVLADARKSNIELEREQWQKEVDEMMEKHKGRLNEPGIKKWLGDKTELARKLQEEKISQARIELLDRKQKVEQYKQLYGETQGIVEERVEGGEEEVRMKSLEEEDDTDLGPDDEVDVLKAPNTVFDGVATDRADDTTHPSEAAKYESGKLKIYKKVVGFFTGNEDATIKFLDDWLKGGEKARKKMESEIKPVPRSVMDQIIETAVKDKNYIKLAQLKGEQVQDIIRQEVFKEMKSMYPNMSAYDQGHTMSLLWMDFFNDAGEEVIHIPGNTTQITLSDKGGGQPHEMGQNGDSEKRAFVKRMKRLWKLKYGTEADAAHVALWENHRPMLAYFSMLTPAMQKIIVWMKANVEDPLFFAATTDVLARADNVNNRAAGYSPRMFVHDLDSERQMGRGVSQSVKSQRVPRKKYRTFGEFAEETKGGIEPVTNYAASAGWYTTQYLIRIHQHGIIEQFKGIRNPESQYDLGVITYASDVERMAASLGLSAKEFLDREGYDQVDNAEGLTKHWRGEFFPPWIHRSVKHAIDRFYIQPQNSVEALKAINEISGFAKRSIMMWPHQFALQITSSAWLWYNSIQEVFDYGILPMFDPFRIAKGMKLGRERATQPFKHMEEEYDHDRLDLFIRNGLRAMNAGWIQKGLYDTREYGSHPLDRNKRDRLGEWIGGKFGLDNYVFEQYMSKAIYRYANAMMERFRADATKRGITFTEEELAAVTVKFVNDTSGTLPSYVYGTEGQWLQFFMFARDFTINFDRQVTGALYDIPGFEGAYKIYDKNRILNPLMHAEATSKQLEFLSPWYRKQLLRTTFIKLGLFALIQAAINAAWPPPEGEDKDENAKWMWMNEPGKRGAIKLPWKSPDGHDYYMDPIIWRELNQFTGMIPEALGGEGPIATAQSKLSYAMRMFFDTVFNRDYLGLEIRDPGGSLAENSLRQAKYYVQQIVPAAFKEQPKELGEWTTPMGLFAKGTQLTGSPLKRGRLAEGDDWWEVRDLRKRQASMTFRKDQQRRQVMNASVSQLNDMISSGEISKDVYKNEVMRRQNWTTYFMKKNYKKLMKDEAIYGIE